MPRGERFFYRHKLAVTDGTPCEVEKNDVCVEGKCMVINNQSVDFILINPCNFFKVYILK